MKDLGLRAGESITGKVHDEGKARLLSDPDEVAEAMADMRPANRTVFTRSIRAEIIPCCVLAVPIAVSDQKLGVLVLETLNGSKEFTLGDVPFVQTLADLIALVIDRSRLQAKADLSVRRRQAERLRSEVLATLSHELRLPLSAIKGYSSALLLEEVKWSEAKQVEFLQQIENESDIMQEMLRDILDASLIDVDQLVLERQPIRLQLMAREIVAEIQRRSNLYHPIMDFPTDFPMVEADPRWIKQVFRNIIDNAIKYSPEGGLIVIKGEVRPSDVVISFADQGIGISSEDLIPLFEKYFRVRSATSLHVAGTGLGLPIARTIVEAHGGRIWAESKVGEGTTLYFSLPKGKPSIDE